MPGQSERRKLGSSSGEQGGFGSRGAGVERFALLAGTAVGRKRDGVEHRRRLGLAVASLRWIERPTGPQRVEGEPCPRKERSAPAFSLLPGFCPGNVTCGGPAQTRERPTCPVQPLRNGPRAGTRVGPHKEH